MRKNVLLLIVFVVLAFAGFSCKDKKTGNQDTLSLLNGSLKVTTYLFDDPTKQSLDIDVSIEYPLSYSDPAILMKVRKLVLLDFYPEADSVYDNPVDAIEAYIDDYKKFFKESEGDLTEDAMINESDESNSVSPWDNTEKMIIRHNANGLFSYTIFSDRFTGGAHGGKNFLNTVVDMKTGEKITEDDLFSETTKPLIVNMIINKIMKMQKVAEASDLQDIGFFDAAEIGLNKNFYLNEKGLTYTYNEYEIAAYAVGTTDVLLTYNEIADLLKEGCQIEGMIE